MERQLDLFAAAKPLPEGLVYQPDFISTDEENSLLSHLEGVQFADIHMHGVIAKRRAAHFGINYEYNSAAVAPGVAIPEFLLPLRERIGKFTGRRPEEFEEVLVTEYPEGAGIGWHRDAPAFEIVVGVSLLAECVMQFRPWPVQETVGGQRREKPLTQVLEPRSLYVIQGPSRSSWQHHIATTKSRRISLTFRTMRPIVRRSEAL
jgi:alkylated DNA repair dioxygenase AlkB